ncbi:ComEA family DNA-binding protein [Paenibacillus sp. YYML68]|uniref:ComEA family DNA-binding protein n=1 Tax=Paenibacillus sp. YYML68 TaxID=2909250 RepID=UPI00248F75C8|nr:helix-hairpin-helix domain-containing protein [Paenibacillus sp. YYML68]
MNQWLGVEGKRMWALLLGGGAVLVLVLRHLLFASPDTSFVAVDETMRGVLAEQAKQREGSVADAAREGGGKDDSGRTVSGNAAAVGGAAAGQGQGDGGTGTTGAVELGGQAAVHGSASVSGGEGTTGAIGSAGAPGGQEASGAASVSGGHGVTGASGSASAPVGVGSAAGTKQPSNAAQSGTAGSGGLLNLNTATAEELDTLPGVGPSRAQAIIELRSKLGGTFRSVDQLREVKGIGEQTLKKIKPLVTLGG